jgi:beta-lactamase superfamily II metal-dependent hydrolase
VTNADQDHLSDLDGLWQEGIAITALMRNPYPAPADLRRVKLQGGPLTNDVQRFLDLHSRYVHPVAEPFDTSMGGIQQRSYCNRYPEFADTNNLSLAVVFEFNGFKILFPGDLERAGWLALLNREDFLAELPNVNILVASHHGRESGYCAEVFDYCRPQAIVMSDKAIQYDTQRMTDIYRQHVLQNHPDGVLVRTTMRRRRVLTTRRDGHIDITVGDKGNFFIDTEHRG